jgi:hypothetical protein
MEDKDILLVMTICDLLEKSTSPHAVELAQARAESALERWRQRSGIESRSPLKVMMAGFAFREP